MTTVTLDYSSSYRAVGTFDITLFMTRDAFGFAGLGRPEGAVRLIGSDGSISDIPASNSYENAPHYYILHSPYADRFDLIANEVSNQPFLSFAVAVDPMPFWEDYVKAVYKGEVQINKYFADLNAYDSAYSAWELYIALHHFKSSIGTLGDNGGTLGQFSSSAPLVVDQFQNSTRLFATHIIGSQFGDQLNGGKLNDTIEGAGGNDAINGGSGADTLAGGAGKDVLTGGGDADTFQFKLTGAGNADKITDFDPAIDRIALAHATFAALNAQLGVSEFRLGTEAQDINDRIIYDQSTGKLWYDPDGTQHGAASAPQQLFAIINNHALLKVDDFLVV